MVNRCEYIYSIKTDQGRFRSGSVILSFVIPGLDPGIHVDGRGKPGHDEERGRAAQSMAIVACLKTA
jgi:hypothetical protein